jgi:phytanoyl-CoA dioxygenase PhyH
LSLLATWVDGLKLQAAERLWRLPRATPEDARGRDLRQELLTTGLCVVPGFLDAHTVDSVAAEAEALYQAYPQHVSLESNGSDQRIYGAERICPGLRLESNMGWVDELSRSFYWSSEVAWFQMLGKIAFRDSNLGSGSGWHRDSPFSHQFKAILYLSDVDDENGPFEYIPGSHLKDRVDEVATFLGMPMRQYRFSDEHVERLENAGLGRRVAVTGAKGSLLLADSRGLHRGKPLRKGGRLAVTRYYFPRRIPADFARRYPLTAQSHSEERAD